MGEPDPETLLATYVPRFDPDTLREVLDEADTALFRRIRAGLTAALATADDEASRARILSLRAVVARALLDLDTAKSDGVRALAYAEAVGELRLLTAVRCRLAHVLQWRGEYASADRLFALANSPDLPDRLRGSVHQHAGKCAYDQGRYMEACNHFERALDLRREDDPDLVASTATALDGLFRRVAEHGWGPYPRTPEEILGTPAAPDPAQDDHSGRWGYRDPATGGWALPPAWADARPFADGVAWVRPPGVPVWALIDAAGTVLIGPSAGLTDVRPVRRGLAAVARGPWWGAVDPAGRVVVPFEFTAFVTALSDGRYVDGFSDGGFAVVERDGRHGVVDHTGRLLVPPVHAAVVIHPVAFLVSDGLRWGALDRRGRRLLDPAHDSRVAVAGEVDRLLADVWTPP